MTFFFCFIRYGGIYLDSDIIVLKPISLLNNCVGMEDRGAGSALNGAVMAFQKHRYCSMLPIFPEYFHFLNMIFKEATEVMVIS